MNNQYLNSDDLQELNFAELALYLEGLNQLEDSEQNDSEGDSDL